MPCSRAPLGQRRQEARGRHDEAALAEDRLDDEAGEVVRADLLLRARRWRGPRRPAPEISDRLAEGVGHRRPVDLAGERPEAVLVGHVLRGHRHRQVGAAVVGVVDDSDRVAAGVRARDLDGVLDRLGAGVEQRRLLLVVARGELGELLADVDVAVVGRDHEAGVGERLHLLDDPLDDLRRGVADTGVTAMPEAEVDQRVAVDVDEHAAAGRLDEHRQRVPTPWATCRLRRVERARRRGPGISVTRRRSWGRAGPPRCEDVMVQPRRRPATEPRGRTASGRRIRFPGASGTGIRAAEPHRDQDSSPPERRPAVLCAPSAAR